MVAEHMAEVSPFVAIGDMFLRRNYRYLLVLWR